MSEQIIDRSSPVLFIAGRLWFGWDGETVITEAQLNGQWIALTNANEASALCRAIQRGEGVRVRTERVAP